MTVEQKLKPCPFCGGSVKLEEVKMRSGTWYGVKCRNTRNLGGDCTMEQVPSRTPEAAVGRWNMRKPEEALHAQLAQCEAMAMMVAEREWAEHVGTGPVSSKVEVAFTQLHNELQEVQGKLAEAQALLRDIASDDLPGNVHPHYRRRASALLSASAAPSAIHGAQTMNDRQVLGLVALVQNDEIDRLKAENEALRKDAERYRWLSQVSTMADKLSPGTVDHAIMLYQAIREEIPDFTPGNGNNARRRAEAPGIDYDAAMAKEVPKG